MHYKVNFRFLVKFLIVSGLILGAVHYWHRRQADKQVQLFRHLAETAREQGRPADEFRYLNRYLALRPADVDARERLGRLGYELAKSPSQALHAFLVLEEALRRDPGRVALRRFNAEVALDPRLMLVTEAYGHIKRLLETYEADGELYGLRGLCWEAGGNLIREGDDGPANHPLVRAERDYAESIRLKAERLDSYVRRAAILRGVRDPTVVQGIKTTISERSGVSPDKVSLPIEADKAIDDLTSKNASNFRAHLYAATYGRQFSQPQRVAVAIKEARRLAPDEAEVILAVAADRREEARAVTRADGIGLAMIRLSFAALAAAPLSEARAELDRGLLLHPTLPALYQARADVEVDADRLDEAESVLQKGADVLPESADLWLSLTDIKVRRNDPAGAERALTRYRELGGAGAIADYQAARIDILHEMWIDAAVKLSRVRDELANTPFARPANLLLARSYQQMGELDRRIDAYARVIADSDPAEPLWLEATLGVAEARADLGQWDEALRLFHTLTARAPGAWLFIARIRFAQEWQKSEGDRDRARVEDAIAQAATIFRDATEVTLLRADYLYYLKDPPDKAAARDLLNGLRDRKPRDVDVWVALAALYVRDSDRPRAVATLDEARQRLGDSVTLRLARARLLVDRSAPDWAAQLRGLGPTDADSFSKSDRLRLARGLADIAAAGGATTLAGDLLTHAAVVAPQNLGVQLRRFDQALQADDSVGAERVLAEIRRIDGPEGTAYRTARAFYLLQGMRKGRFDAAVLAEVDRLLEAADGERPGWARIATGQAVAAELRGDRTRALERYLKAVDQGEMDTTVIRRIVEIYREQGRDREAEEFLLKRPAALLDTTEMSRLAAEVSFRNRNPERAAKLAEKLKDSPEYRDQLWLAQVRWAANPGGKEWEEPLRKAVAQANGDPAPLVTLVQFLAATRQRTDLEKAEQAIAEFGGAVAGDRRALAQALCLLAIGKTQEADQGFRAAFRERPTDIRVIRAYADFLTQRGEFEAAGSMWQKVRELPTATAADRDHALDMILICTRLNPRQDYSKALAVQEAVGLRHGGVPKAPTDDMRPEELRRTARRLAIQMDRASKVRAIEYLDRLEKALLPTGQHPQPADYFFRGQLNASLNQPDAARTDLALAIDADRKNPTFLAYYVNLLIRQQRPDLLKDAARWLEELRKIQRDEFRTAELQARLAVAQGQRAEARKTLENWEQKENAPIGRLAAVYEEVGLFEDAGRLYQAIGERVNRAEGLLPYAAFLGRRQRTEEALRRCDEARKQNCPPAALVEVGVLILYAARTPADAQIDRVLSWTSEALLKSDSQPATTASLLNHKAAILNLLGKYGDAITVYERLLAINPRDALAMNNLGYLLAAIPERRDFSLALGWLDKAKGVVGPLPELLDTEALIHLARAKANPASQGQNLQAALSLLGDVEVQAPSATVYFHLALAHFAAGHEGEARSAWTEAQNRKLAVGDLHPLERSDYADLQKQFGG